MRTLASLSKRTRRIAAAVALLLLAASAAVGGVASGNLNLGALAGAAAGGTCTVGASGATYTTIQAAVGDTGCATINVAAGTYNEHIAIQRSVTINGAGAANTIVDGTANGAVFWIGLYSDPPWTVSLSGLTIRNGYATDVAGGIYMNYGGRLTVRDSIISNNRSASTNSGGGISFYNNPDDSNARLDIINSTFSNNQAANGGSAISVAGWNNMPALTVSNSTFSGNLSTNGVGSAVFSTGATTIQSSTFVNNTGGALEVASAAEGGSVINSTFFNNTSGQWHGGAIHRGSNMKGAGSLILTNDTIVGNSSGVVRQFGEIYFQNTIIANNTGGNCKDPSGNWPIGTHDNGKNLRWPSSDSSCYGTFGDPKLAALTDMNGGPTPTMMLLAGSAAIDKGTCVYATDQRGYYRPSGATCDIGAVEAGSIGPSRPTPTSAPTAVPTSTPLPTPVPQPQPGLVGYWKFDEGSGTTAYDYSGQSRHGVLVHGPNYTVTTPYLRFSNPSALNFSGGEIKSHVEISGINIANGSFSVAGWAIRATTSGKQWLVVQGQNLTDQALVVGFRDNDHFTCAFYSDDLDTASQYLDSQWHHWACTFDAATRARKIYRDGALVASDTSKAVPQTGTGTFYLGAAPWNAGEGYFDGAIDDWRVYNRPLTAAEVQSLAAGNS